nr:MAG TPA: hypothetical protein [Caudoviricetes sp.]DAZ38449.1 MAG TPA: hypothetical protein [Caudoviricetes sp.]
MVAHAFSFVSMPRGVKPQGDGPDNKRRYL